MFRRVAPVVLLVFLGTPLVASAQDDDWGITRNPRGPNKTKVVRPRQPRQPREPRPPVASPGAQNDRNDVLIQRYLRVLEADPRESFAFQRLVDLYRERDGSVDRLLEELRRRAAQDPRAFAPRMILGHLHRARNDAAAALASYQEAAALRPQDPAPAIAIARLRRGTDPAEARRLLEQALAATREATDREGLIRELGEVALDMADLEGARQYYDRLARDAGQSVFLRTELGRALAARGRHADAVQEYQRVLRALRGDNRVIGPVLRDLAQAQLDSGQADEAIATLDRALRVAEPGVRREIRDVLVDAYRRGDRLPELAERLGREANDFETLELLGRVHDELGNEPQAAEAYRRALRRNARDIDVRVALTHLLSRSGRMDEVIAEYRALIRIAPREPRFVVELAQLLMQTGRRDEALRLAAETGRRFGSEASVHSALAELYSRWGEDQLALREMEALARIDPRDPGHLEALGAQQLSAGQRDAALATWRRILTADDDRARAHATLGAIYADNDMLADAETAYREAVRLEPERLEYVRGHANVLERLRRDPEAVVAWQRVLDLAGPDRAARREARQRVVAIWARSGQLAGRIAELQRRFRATPPDPEAGRFLAEALRASRNQGAEAMRVLAEVIAIEPGDVESLLALERARATAGDLAGAIEILARLVEADARRAPGYLQRMAEHSLALYRDEDAVRYAERAVQHTPDDADAHRRLGDLYRARQDTERAIASYRRAIELDERLFPTYLELAELHLARGENAEADRLFRRVLRASPDDDLIARAARAAIQIHLGAGTLEQLEQELLPLAIGHTQRPIYRRSVVELYDALATPLIARARASNSAVEEREVRERLRRIGSRAIHPLLEALADSDPAQQRVAIAILGHLGNPNAAAPLLAMASGAGEYELRERALLAAAAVAGPDLVPRFVDLVRGQEQRPRALAMLALARIVRDDSGRPRAEREVLPVLRQGLEHSDAAVRAFAAIGIGRARDGASREALVRMMTSAGERETTRAAAAWAIGQLGDLQDDELRTDLVVSLRTGHLLARAAADALARAGGERGRDAVAEMIFDADPERRAAGAAALRLAAMPERDRPDARALDLQLAREAARGSWDNAAAPYVALLLARGGAPENAPVELGPILPALERAAQAALVADAQRVTAALAVLASRAGVGLGALTDPMPRWPEGARTAAEADLARFAAAIAPTIAQAAAHADVSIRAAAVRLLGSVPGHESTAAILAALEDRQAEVRRAALQAVGPAQPAAVEPVARILARDRDWAIRTRAAEALGRMGTPEAVGPLAQALRDDRYAFVREAAAHALRGIDAPEARAALRQAATQDPEPRVRAAASLPRD